MHYILHKNQQDDYVFHQNLLCAQALARSNSRFVLKIKFILLSVFGGNFMEWPIHHNYITTLYIEQGSIFCI